MYERAIFKTVILDVKNHADRPKQLSCSSRSEYSRYNPHAKLIIGAMMLSCRTLDSPQLAGSTGFCERGYLVEGGIKQGLGSGVAYLGYQDPEVGRLVGRSMHLIDLLDLRANACEIRCRKFGARVQFKEESCHR